MKLIVQIPCFSEQATLAETVAGIPRRIENIDEVELLVVDDGSTDRTAAVAREAGVDHIVRHRRNRGLAHAFSTGMEAWLGLDADIIVDTGADNQYPGRYIPHLVRPILDGCAGIVVGDRRPASNPHFAPAKRWLQRAGSADLVSSNRRLLETVRAMEVLDEERSESRWTAARTSTILQKIAADMHRNRESSATEILLERKG